MADKKITELVAYSTPISTDVLPIVDVTTGMTKKITRGNLILVSDVLRTNNLLHIQDQKAQNTAGGTFTLGAWRTRDLNTKLTDNISGASLAGNQITLPTGSYWIDASAPASNVDLHQTAVYNVSDAAFLLIGTSERSPDATNDQCRSFVSGLIAIAAQKIITLIHYSIGTAATLGFGRPANITTEVYSDIKIWKVA